MLPVTEIATYLIPYLSLSYKAWENTNNMIIITYIALLYNDIENVQGYLLAKIPGNAIMTSWKSRWLPTKESVRSTEHLFITSFFFSLMPRSQIHGFDNGLATETIHYHVA